MLLNSAGWHSHSCLREFKQAAHTQQLNLSHTFPESKFVIQKKNLNFGIQQRDFEVYDRRSQPYELLKELDFAHQDYPQMPGVAFGAER